MTAQAAGQGSVPAVSRDPVRSGCAEGRPSCGTHAVADDLPAQLAYAMTWNAARCNGAAPAPSWRRSLLGDGCAAEPRPSLSLREAVDGVPHDVLILGVTNSGSPWFQAAHDGAG